jgi:molybdopterin molybdotransferase
MTAVAAGLIDVATARALVLERVAPLAPETVELSEALDRVLAEDVESADDLPPFDSSAMDGYAVVAGAGADLPVVGESRAGHPAERGLRAGEAMVISTGAAVPAGADAVVPVERAEVLDGRVHVPEAAPGDHVRRAGEDVRAGSTVLRAGASIGPAEIGVLAALGRPRVACGRRPRVAVLVTGDELLEPDQPLRPGLIRDSNAYALSAQAARAGAAVVAREVVPDEPEATRAALERALGGADVVCVSGGVSVGPHDHVKPALAALDVEEVLWGVALKPGKPTWFGVRGSQPVFGLPGNPVSAMVTFHLFARPALRRLAGADPADARTTAVLEQTVERRSTRDQVLRCRLAVRDDGWHVTPTGRQGSHVLTSMLGAGAFALVPAGEGAVEAGERVEIELLY